MAAIFDISNLTINEEEAQELSKAIFELALEQGDLAAHHDIQSGIQHKTQIPFIGTLGLVGKKVVGCKPDVNGNQIPFSEKFWDPELVGDRLAHCATDVNPLFKLFKKAQKINPDYFDRIDSEELGVVLMRLSEAMKEMLIRLVWFGDKGIDTVANGGVLKNGTDKDFFNIIDGLWKQILTIDIPSNSKYRVAIDANAEANYADQYNLADDFAFKLFRSMWQKPTLA